MGLLLSTVSQSCKIKNKKNCSCVAELKIKAKLKNAASFCKLRVLLTLHMISLYVL